jgi:hypothetical protein
MKNHIWDAVVVWISVMFVGFVIESLTQLNTFSLVTGIVAALQGVTWVSGIYQGHKMSVVSIDKLTKEYVAEYADQFKEELTLKHASLIRTAVTTHMLEHESQEYTRGYKEAQSELAEMLELVAKGRFQIVGDKVVLKDV